ncbi:MAG: TIGR04255 family protein [Gemmatimonadales bacterium]
MTEPEHLQHAPIVEAALGVAVTLPSTIDQEKLASFQERLSGQYPTKEVRMFWSGQVELKPDSPQITTTSGGPTGYLFKSADGKQAVQALRQGFVFSRFQPYQDWDTFSREARELWSRYATLLTPEKVTRISLRYINRLELPLPFNDFKEYLLTVPEVASGLPQGLSGFFFRVVIPVEEAEAFGTITETIVEGEVSKGVVPLILDIDVFRLGTFPIVAEKLWPAFDRLRELKNLFFFKSLTDKAKDLFK